MGAIVIVSFICISSFVSMTAEKYKQQYLSSHYGSSNETIGDEIENISDEIEKEVKKEIIDKIKKYCCIFEAAYGSETEKELDILRSFRDKVLLAIPMGKTFVRAYYGVSPPVAEEISKNEIAKNAIRFLFVNPAVILAKIIMNWILGIIIIITLMIILWKMKLLAIVLKSLFVGVIAVIVCLEIAILLGWLSYMWHGFAFIAMCILPLMLPLAFAIFTWTLIREVILRAPS